MRVSGRHNGTREGAVLTLRMVDAPPPSVDRERSGGHLWPMRSLLAAGADTAARNGDDMTAADMADEVGFSGAKEVLAMGATAAVTAATAASEWPEVSMGCSGRSRRRVAGATPRGGAGGLQHW